MVRSVERGICPIAKSIMTNTQRHNFTTKSDGDMGEHMQGPQSHGSEAKASEGYWCLISDDTDISPRPEWPTAGWSSWRGGNKP